MSATFSGPIVLENPQVVQGSPRSVEFDGQMWVGPNRVLRGRFRYFNTTYMTFNEIGHYFAWIHVARAVPGIEVSTSDQEVSDEDALGSETLADDYHVYGDIAQLIGSTADAMKHAPYVTFSGAAFNSNQTEGFFDVSAAQYTSFYRTQRDLSTLPIRAFFDDTRYKNKKPVASNNSYVAVEGFLSHIEIDSDTGQASLFHVGVDNISFLGRAVVSTPGQSNQASPSTPSRSSRFKFNFGSIITSPQSDTASGSTNLTPSKPSKARKRARRK